MKTSTSQEKHKIQWTAWMQLNDLDFAGDLDLLSYTHQQMQVKTNNVAAAFVSVGLNIHKGKRKIPKHNTENTKPNTINGKALEDMENFTYPDGMIIKQVGSGADMKAGINKARAAFL
ncbi:unnamed protein product [Schistosoma margrebowiei]|uniref:Uncharacterized protein n=1 Tax=Schistosoma margrebowiei TaxID=48269 RepID=A0A183LL64_9TREM|nr:unnamed protein product [Schistosoma margrebowiei]